MKRIFYTFVILLAVGLLGYNSIGVATAQSGTQSHKFGYAHASAQSIGIGPKSTAYFALAIKLPQLPGNIIKGITFHTQPGQFAENASVFIASNKEKKIVVFQSINYKSGINEIRLNDPFVMEDGEEYFVGYQVQARSDARPLAMDATAETAMPMTNYIEVGGNYARVDDPIELGEYYNPKIGNAMIFVDIEDTSKKLANVGQLVGGGFSETELTPNQPAALKLKVRNLGYKAINTLDISTQHGQKDAISQTISSLDIAPGSTQEVEVRIQAPARGIGTIRTAITSANAQTNPLKEWSRLYPYRVATPNGARERASILIERFTTERCGNCPASEKPFESLVEQMRRDGIKVSVIAHHAGYGRDKFTLKESSALLPYSFGGALREYAPALMLNRVADDLNMLSLAGSYTERENKYRKAKAIEEVAKFTEIKSSVEGDRISLTIKGNTGYLDQQDFYITAVVTEDKIPAISQSGVPFGHSFVHHHVARKFLTPALGQHIALGADGSFSLELKDLTYSEDWKKENLSIIVFAHQNLSAERAENKTVYTSATIGWNSSLSTESISGIDQIRPRVVDGYLVCDAPIDDIHVYTLSGRLVALSGSTRLLPGLYIVRLSHQGKQSTHRVIVPDVQ